MFVVSFTFNTQATDLKRKELSTYISEGFWVFLQQASWKLDVNNQEIKKKKTMKKQILVQVKILS